MKKRLAMVISTAMIMSSMIMPIGAINAFATNGFMDEDALTDEVTEEFVEEEAFGDDIVIDTEGFEEETEEKSVFEETRIETESEAEVETETNEEYEASVTGTCGTNLKWSYENGVLTISGTGKMTAYSYVFNAFRTTAPWAGFLNDIKKIVIKEGVTTVGNYAFFGCTNVTELELPRSLISIDKGAFIACASLTRIDIPQGVTMVGDEAFMTCPSVQEIRIPKSVKSIGNQAFAGNGIADIEIPSSVTSIGAEAFENCNNLKKITFWNDQIELGKAIFAINNIDINRNLPNVTIYCRNNSTALVYAKNNNISYVIVDGSDVDVEKIRGFVNRLYQTCLNRNTDENGLNYWMNRLANGNETGASAAGGFIFSNESINKNLCNSCFIDQLYKCFLGRNADSNGKNYWLGQIKGGKTRAEIFGGFVVSNEFKKICADYGIEVGSPIWSGNTGVLEGDCKKCGAKNKTVLEFIERMYKVCLGRGSDSGGRTYWLNQIKSGKTGEQIAWGFLSSTEIVNKNLTNDAFVEICYRAFFGRSADTNGKVFWVNKLKNGETRQRVVSGFAASTEFRSLCIEYGIVAK